ncbi:hypothetical protein HIM_02056 [Hirsutella minnesotensis 3608]|nr:hypothetical protein HIM_02056 [Hirsutella minnesotensis 3608]
MRFVKAKKGAYCRYLVPHPSRPDRVTPSSTFEKAQAAVICTVAHSIVWICGAVDIALCEPPHYNSGSPPPRRRWQPLGGSCASWTRRPYSIDCNEDRARGDRPRVNTVVGVVRFDWRTRIRALSISRRISGVLVDAAQERAGDILGALPIPRRAPSPGYKMHLQDSEVEKGAATHNEQDGFDAQQPSTQGSAPSSAHSFSRSVTNSQETAATVSTDQIVTPPPSETSAGLDVPGQLDSGMGALDRKQPKAQPPTKGDSACGNADRQCQLLQLSTIAAAQDKMMPEGTAGSKKRMADGLLKLREGSASPVKGHSRNASAVSMASTAASHIGEVSNELKTLLSYAMVKVNNGWQSRSLDAVESLASQATSPTSSVHTVHHRKGSSASPLQPAAPPSARVHFSQDSQSTQRDSSPPASLPSDKPILAAPAPIRPSLTLPQSALHPRRTSGSLHAPTMLSRQTSDSPRTPRTDGPPLPISRTEQDVAESLLFMSSPGNSANMKHSFLPSVSPGSQQPDTSTRPASTRHALPSGPRKALPSQRPSVSTKKASGMLPPGSPMDLDSPNHVSRSPIQGTPKRRANGVTTHTRASLSLPSALGVVPGVRRKSVRDEDIEQMLDRAGSRPLDSSDDEEIQLPAARRQTTGVTGR